MMMMIDFLFSLLCTAKITFYFYFYPTNRFYFYPTKRYSLLLYLALSPNYSL